MKQIVIRFLKLLPIKFRISLFFLHKQHYIVNLSKPVSLSEKIQKRKLSLSQIDADLADKYKVREYVEKLIGQEYLIPIVGVYDALTIDVLHKIPMDSVIKTTHGSGSSHIHFFDEDSDKAKVVSQFEHALREDYIGSVFGETHYDLIERKVIIEKKLDFEGDSPPDYKFHVFRKNGTVSWILQVDFDRFTDHKRNYYDSDLNLLDIQVIYENGNFTLPNRESVNEMVDIAIKLNDKYHYSRVDLYLHNGNVFFGEITLTPGSGFERFSSKDFDIKLGELWG